MNYDIFQIMLRYSQNHLIYEWYGTVPLNVRPLPGALSLPPPHQTFTIKVLTTADGKEDPVEVRQVEG